MTTNNLKFSEINRHMKTFLHPGKKHELTPTQRLIFHAPRNLIESEYHLIQQKKSNLSRSMRDTIEHRYNYLVKNGTITPAK